MRYVLPFSEFTDLILEDVSSKESSAITKYALFKAFNEINFKNNILKTFPTVEFRNFKKPEILYRIGLLEQMDKVDLKELRRYIHRRIKYVFDKKIKEKVFVNYGPHKEVAKYSNSFEISIDRTGQKFYIIISMVEQNGNKNEVIQADNINAFIQEHKQPDKNYIPLIRYKPNNSNEFNIVYATRSEQVDKKAKAKADVVIYGYESLKSMKEKPIMWLSLKAGSSPRDFQQYLDVSASAITTMGESKINTSYIVNFLKCCQLLIEKNPEKYERNSLQLLSPPVPTDITKYAIYGRDCEKSFGWNNVNYLIQGNIQFNYIEEKKGYEISGSAFTLRHNNLPEGNYAPKILIRQSKNDKINGYDKLSHHRLFIAPKFYNLSSSENIIEALNKEFNVNVNSLEEFLKIYPKLEKSNSSS